MYYMLNISVNNIFAAHEGRAIKPGAEEPEKWRYSLFKQRLLVAYLIRGNWRILVCFEGNLSTFTKDHLHLI